MSPLTKNVGYNMEELAMANKNRKMKRPHKQMVAIAIEAARRSKKK